MKIQTEAQAYKNSPHFFPMFQNLEKDSNSVEGFDKLCTHFFSLFLKLLSSPSCYLLQYFTLNAYNLY